MWMTAQEEDGGFVLASTFVKKTEDQLDPYREWIFLILDHPQDVFGWTSKSKQRMQQFKTDLVAQISEAIGLPEDRLRVQRVLKAKQRIKRVHEHVSNSARSVHFAESPNVYRNPVTDLRTIICI